MGVAPRFLCFALIICNIPCRRFISALSFLRFAAVSFIRSWPILSMVRFHFLRWSAFPRYSCSLISLIFAWISGLMINSSSIVFLSFPSSPRWLSSSRETALWSLLINLKMNELSTWYVCSKSKLLGVNQMSIRVDVTPFAVFPFLVYSASVPSCSLRSSTNPRSVIIVFISWDPTLG